MSVANYPLVYAAKSQSEDVRFLSSSGGAFFEVARPIIEGGGVVYGCAFDVNQRATHIRCDKVEDLKRCMGSKYSQSSMGNTIREICRDLAEGKTVMFSGTPCQVDAVKGNCGGDSDRLLLVDIVCHGVPSPGLFQMHIAFLESLKEKMVTRYEHRPKNTGWGHNERITFEDGRVEQGTRLAESWKGLFYNNRMLRPSCYVCPYTTTNRSSDITLADFWGIESTPLSSFADTTGISLILVSTKRGEDYLSAASLELLDATVDMALPRNPMLTRPVEYRGDRNAPWITLYERGYAAMLKEMRFYPSYLRWKIRRVRASLKNRGRF